MPAHAAYSSCLAAGVSKQRKEKLSSKRDQKEKEAAAAKIQAKMTQAQVRRMRCGV
jgi:hypothetical protein